MSPKERALRSMIDLKKMIYPLGGPWKSLLLLVSRKILMNSNGMFHQRIKTFDKSLFHASQS